MIPGVSVRKEAEQDIAVSAEWYERQRKGLGVEFVGAVASVFELIAEKPLMFPEVHEGMRRGLTPHFPYGVFYKLHEGSVVVFAVLHGRRDPGRWKSRK